MDYANAIPQDTKKAFMKLGTCSRTFFFILNRKFGYMKEVEEQAADSLAGGIMGRGHQCGMLWGATLAVGAEAFRKHKNSGKAIGVAITGAKHLVESFSNRTGTIQCRQITGYNLLSKFDMIKFIIKFILRIDRRCFKLADKWAPEAIEAANKGLSQDPNNIPGKSLSCASLVAEKMGASDEQKIMVAGFAGGIGLSGDGCGALGAAVWMRTLDWCKENPGKMAYNNPYSEEVVELFIETNGPKILCSEICGKHFKTVEDHTEFIKNGGCDTIINSLAKGK